MDTLVSYLIRSLLISGLMLGYYLAVLRNRKLHAFNRVWLLSALLASLVLPLIRLNWLKWHSAARPQLVGLIAATHPAAAKTFPVWTVILLAGGSISLVLLAILAIRVLRVYRLKRGHRVQQIDGCVLIEIKDRRAPFSFLKNLFWQEGADIHDPVNRKILDHELAHIRGGHTYDILFAQTLAAVCWFNPFYWLIRRELQMVHEFIADNVSIAAGDTETFARMLLQAYDRGRYLDPSHPFYFSPIKRRLLMISSSKPPSRWRMALALPALLAVMVLACSKEQSAPAQLIKPLPADIVRQDIVRQLKAVIVRQLKISRDSVQVTMGTGLKKVFRINFDTLGSKAKLDLQLSDPIITNDGKADNDKVPPPPILGKVIEDNGRGINH